MHAVRTSLTALCLALGAGFSGAATVTIAQTDFESPTTFAPGVVDNTTGPGVPQAALGGPYLGSHGKSWSGNHLTVFDTGMLTISLSGLPVHSSLTVDFLLGFLNSWDSTNGSQAPDILSISIEGGPVIQLTTATASGNVTDYQGGTLLVDNGQIDQSVFFFDDLVDMGTASFLTFAHTASTFTMTIQAGGAGWQGGTDEYWGLDAISITAQVPGGGNVPEPGLPMLLGAALLAAGLTQRARQSR